MKSKEDQILNLFYDYPTKYWHFEELVKEAGIARSKVDSWLKRLLKELLIRKIKPRSKMPYYISNYGSPEYKNRKRIFALNRLYDSGFLNHLYTLKKARTIIVFGSFSRSDWSKESDIDLFVYGDTEDLKIARYELQLHREIQVFSCKNNQELEKFGEGLIKNIIKGNLIKGDLDFIKVQAHAEIPHAERSVR